MKETSIKIRSAGAILLLLFVASCAPGNEMFNQDPASFWAGLWHGLICGISFIVGLFTDSVHMYETNNTGGWYDFGFLMGAAVFLGGSGAPAGKKLSRKKTKDQEWEEIGTRVEEKIRRGIQKWLEECDQEEKDWEEIGEKIEEKIKRELRKWAEK